jgi:hypothetical protein
MQVAVSPVVLPSPVDDGSWQAVRVTFEHFVQLLSKGMSPSHLVTRNDAFFILLSFSPVESGCMLTLFESGEQFQDYWGPRLSHGMQR